MTERCNVAQIRPPDALAAEGGGVAARDGRRLERVASMARLADSFALDGADAARAQRDPIGASPQSKRFFLIRYSC